MVKGQDKESNKQTKQFKLLSPNISRKRDTLQKSAGVL